MVESIPSLIRTIESHVTDDIEGWYVGLTDDPEACAVSLRLGSERDLAWWQALTSEDALGVHETLRSRGMAGEDTGHQDANLYVYVYRR